MPALAVKLVDVTETDEGWFVIADGVTVAKREGGRWVSEPGWDVHGGWPPGFCQ